MLYAKSFSKQTDEGTVSRMLYAKSFSKQTDEGTVIECCMRSLLVNKLMKGQ